MRSGLGGVGVSCLLGNDGSSVFVLTFAWDFVAL